MAPPPNISRHNRSSGTATVGWPVWWGLATAVILDTVAQVCWKAAVNYVPANAGMWVTLLTTLRQPIVYVMLLAYVLAFANWLGVLAKADLSYAQPITALSYVTVTGCSLLLFQERLSGLRLLGLALILLGVWTVSLTHVGLNPLASAAGETRRAPAEVR